MLSLVTLYAVEAMTNIALITNSENIGKRLSEKSKAVFVFEDLHKLQRRREIPKHKNLLETM